MICSSHRSERQNRDMQSIAIYLITTLQFLTVHAGESFRDTAAPSELAKPNYHDDDDLSHCVPIREPVCQGLQYSETRMPNWVKMTSQEEAAKRMIDYRSLLNINCSHYLNLFLCTIYFPMCTRVLVKSALKPCKPLCVHVRNRCEPIMQQFQFNWPTELACDDLPEPPALCIEPDGYALDSKRPVLPNLSAIAVSESESGTGNPNLRSLQRLYPQLEEILRQRNQDSGNLNSLIQAAVAAVDNGALTADQDVACTGTEFTANHFFNSTCLVYCGADLHYRAADKTFARNWLLTWSCLCLASTVLTFLTFLTDTSRLRYPERPVIYLAACYFALAFGYVLQYCLGAETVTCKSVNPAEAGNAVAVGTRSETEIVVENMQKYLLKSGQEGTWCTVGFLILYYFGTASNLWWVMLSLAWYLSTARKWGHEGVESVSCVFHMFAWALPAIQAILLLILHKIDADELTGTCYTGFHNENALIFGVLLPQTIYLTLGLILLSVGFAAVFQVRQKLKVPSGIGDRERDSRRRLEKSIAKLGVFAVLYTFPMACLLAGNLYEYIGQPKWRSALADLHRDHPQCLSPRGIAWGIDKCQPKHSPSPEAALLRIFMSLVVGITSGMWVWANKKSFHSWRNLFCRRGRWRSNVFDKLEGNLHSRRALVPSASLRAPQLFSNAAPLELATTDTAPVVARPANPFGGAAFPSNMCRNYQTAGCAYSAPGCHTCLTARENTCPPGMSPTTPSYTSSQTADLFPLNVDGLTDCYLQRPEYRPSASTVTTTFPQSYPYTAVSQQTLHHHPLHSPMSAINVLGMQQFNGRPINSVSAVHQ
uniref:Frizzled-10-A n=1 Tax=Schistocephalus solidus TaxID=70667 RepID=A0A0V0J3C8_SCHSO